MPVAGTSSNNNNNTIIIIIIIINNNNSNNNNNNNKADSYIIQQFCVAGWLLKTSKQTASIPQGRICLDNCKCCHLRQYRLVGLVVKASVSGAEDPRFESRVRRDFFSGSSHTSDFKIGTPVATLPGAWRDRVSAGTGRPGVSLL